MSETIQCPSCNGMGFVYRDVMTQDKDGNVTTTQTDERCGQCGGSGSVQGH